MINLNKKARHAALVALAAAATAFAATASFAVPHFDGLWSVSIVTEKGSCDRGYRYPIRIANGVLANAGSAPVAISGKVADSGAIVVTVSYGPSRATGRGRLSGNSGAGLWSGGDCSGKWTAQRRNAAENR